MQRGHESRGYDKEGAITSTEYRIVSFFFSRRFKTHKNKMTRKR